MPAHAPQAQCNQASAAAQNRNAGLARGQRQRDRADHRSATTISPRISPAFQLSWLTPSASELLIECSAMHGYSEPVRQRTMHSTNPRNPSGTRYCGEADPVCASPNRIPVMIAATHAPMLRPATAIRHPPQRAEQEAAEEELLGDRRDHADEDPGGHERRRAVVGAELAGQLVAAVQVEQLRPDRGGHVVAQRRGDHGDHAESADGSVGSRSPPVARAPAADREVQRRGDEP